MSNKETSLFSLSKNEPQGASRGFCTVTAASALPLTIYEAVPDLQLPEANLFPNTVESLIASQIQPIPGNRWRRVEISIVAVDHIASDGFKRVAGLINNRPGAFEFHSVQQAILPKHEIVDDPWNPAPNWQYKHESQASESRDGLLAHVFNGSLSCVRPRSPTKAI